MLNEDWQREVSRCVELSECVTGEARVRQSLEGSLSNIAIGALESAMAADSSGWREVDQGYRFDVEGGYAIYLVVEQALEIVAQLSDEVHAEGRGSRVLSGHVGAELSAEGV